MSSSAKPGNQTSDSAPANSDSDIPETLPFMVAPAFLEDLGVNLYTSLDKVLVEFVANAHDADAEFAKITSVSSESINHTSTPTSGPPCWAMEKLA